jgi:hypothetical protein
VSERRELISYGMGWYGVSFHPLAGLPEKLRASSGGQEEEWRSGGAVLCCPRKAGERRKATASEDGERSPFSKEVWRSAKVDLLFF